MVGSRLLDPLRREFRYESSGRVAFRLLNGILLIGLGLTTLFPFLHILAGSLSNPILLLQGAIGFIPREMTLRPYAAVLQHPLIASAYRNTILYTSVGTAANLALTTCGAYPLSRRRFVGRKLFSFLIVFTMIVQGGLIPTFLVVRSLGLLDTFWVMILPTAISAFNLIVLRTFFSQQPEEIEESAIIDGASEFQIMVRIVVPLAVPGLLTIGLFYAVFHWNSFFEALIYLRSRNLVPMQIVLREIVIESNVDEMAESAGAFDLMSESVKYATIMVATIPILLVYPFIQKHFVKGVMIGSLKG
jgi:putative aldouronate transport system permease protein